MKVRWVAIIVIIILSFIGLVYFLGLGGAIAGAFATLAIFALFNPDKATGYLASIYKGLRNVSFWFERSAVEKRVESTIGLSSKKVNGEGVSLLPHGINVKWVETKDREAFLKDGKIVVCFEPSVNESRNLARAAILYTSEDLIRESQRFVNRTVMKAACFAVARKMLMFDRRLDALKCLNEEFLQPEIVQHPSIGEYVETMRKLDSEGYLTRMLLNELSELDAKLLSTLSDPRAEAETLNLMQAMKRLAEKEEGIDVNTDHRGRIIDFKTILIAREGIKDPNRYIGYAKKCWNEGAPKIYVLAQGDRVMTAVAAVLGVKTSGLYRIGNEWKFKVPAKRGSFDSYVAVLARIEQ